MDHKRSLKRCFREPIQEIFDAARYLDAAVSAHLAAHRQISEKLLYLSNDPKIRAWTNSIWGKNSPYVTVIKQTNLPLLPRVNTRKPTSVQIFELHKRDGYHCRFCGLPVIRAEIRRKLSHLYPNAVPWGKTNESQHAALQAMWVQYDHVVPYSHGGTNDLKNLVVTCAACNYGKMSYTLEELSLLDPRLYSPDRSRNGALYAERV